MIGRLSCIYDECVYQKDGWPLWYDGYIYLHTAAGKPIPFLSCQTIIFTFTLYVASLAAPPPLSPLMVQEKRKSIG